MDWCEYQGVPLNVPPQKKLPLTTTIWCAPLIVRAEESTVTVDGEVAVVVVMLEAVVAAPAGANCSVATMLVVSIVVDPGVHDTDTSDENDAGNTKLANPTLVATGKVWLTVLPLAVMPVKVTLPVPLRETPYRAKIPLSAAVSVSLSVALNGA